MELQVKEISESVCGYEPGSPDSSGATPTQAQILIGFAENVELFSTPDLDGFTTFAVGDHSETWPIKSKTVRRWLTRKSMTSRASRLEVRPCRTPWGFLRRKHSLRGLLISSIPEWLGIMATLIWIYATKTGTLSRSQKTVGSSPRLRRSSSAAPEGCCLCQSQCAAVRSIS